MFQDHDDMGGLPWLMEITLIMTASFGLPIGRECSGYDDMAGLHRIT